MSVFESIRMALTALRANILRSALTLLGMVIGVFAVIAAVTAVEVIEVYFEESLQIYGSSTFSVERYESQIGGRDRDVYHPPITWEQVVRLKRSLPGGLQVSVDEDFDWIVKAKYEERETEPNLQLRGTDEHFLSNFGFELAAGRPITAQDVQYARPVAVLGAPVAETLFPNQSALGKEVRIGRVRLEVIGVLEEKATFLGFDPNARVWAPISYMLSTYGDNGRNIASVSVRAPNPQMVRPAQETVMAQMRTIRKVRPGDQNNFFLETNASLQDQLASFTGSLGIAGAAIGLISLLAAGIGIMNIMLVSVTERTREIGIRKAVGAKNWHVLSQFLLEAIVLCQIGGLLGILLGALAGNGVAFLFDISMAFPWLWAGIAVTGVTLIAVVFGLYPAFKASRLDPIESLRYE
ncbi:ABC transporter permease [Longibacter sp.]|jgi:putative ABC transport system permease protein|uniref:ABC transporter permease n=1 Tax=Longibacter sp. TaxID=2045415 RepID=UPI003EB84C80